MNPYTKFFIVPICLVVIGHASAQPSQTVDFIRDIKPILSDRCYTCHGPDQGKRKAKLRLDTRTGAFAKTRLGEASHVVTAGSPEKSELYLRLITEFDDERMPPAKAKLSISRAEIELIRRWIEQGAKWEDGHWSYRPVQSPKPPSVKNKAWPRNPIDQFVLARLEASGMSPSVRASRETLIRRVTFDLTGLPPTLAEIDAFLADQSDHAYEKLVDRLLASPRYGERMAADWLDIARYSDSYGYQVDRDRFVWPWRDWVIKAFNRNQPYDEFVTWQIAGDLFPNASDEQMLATTFNRLHPQKVEGGSVPEEFRVEYVADRTHTFGTAFLGMTLECARCHDHKYDPISHEEYYQFFAYFNRIDEAGLYSYFTSSVPTPTLRLIDSATKKRVTDAEKAIETQAEKLRAIALQSKPAFETWLENRPALPSVPGRMAHVDFEKVSGPNQSVAGRIGKAIKLTGDDAYGLKVGNFRRSDPFSISLWMNTPDHKERAVVFHRSRAWTDAGSRGYELLLEDGKLSAALVHFYPGNAIRVRSRDSIPTKKWIHVTLTYDGSSRADGITLYVDGKSVPTEVVQDQLTKNMTGGGGNNIAIGQRFRDRGFAGGMVDEFKVFSRELTPIEVDFVAGGTAFQNALTAKELTPQQKLSLAEFYFATSNKEYVAQLAELKKSREQRNKIEDGLPEIMVMKEMNSPRKSFQLLRGAYNKHGKEVTARTPAALPTFGEGTESNRLDLAKWLTHAKNPLTPRVTVNRLWQMLFGEGLVRTPEDFGSQGEPPTHPLLLDWLAADFVHHKWDVKRLLKSIVMSATYQQSSTPSADILKRDPENRLLGRAPSFRMTAEMLRDNALAVSELLVEKIGGPPARPYEVEASFKPTKRDRGEGLYRRSVYTYWKRTAPAPAMMTLDSSKRDVCRPHRERTSSPLQAFVMLNGPQFVEASRILAQVSLTESKNDINSAIGNMFRRLTSRRITDKELELVRRLYDHQLKHFKNHPDKAKELLTVGDAKSSNDIPNDSLAAMAVVGNTLMNYHDCVMRR